MVLARFMVLTQVRENLLGLRSVSAEDTKDKGPKAGLMVNQLEV